MTKRMINKMIAFVLAAVMVLGCTDVSTYAAAPELNGTYIKTYGLSTGNDTPVYTSKDLTTRGTASPSRAYNATLYADDEVWIYSISEKWAYISYPTGSGRRYGYIRISAITPNNFSVGAKTCRGNMTTYRRPGSIKYGIAETGDTVYTIGSMNGYKQIIYSCGHIWKMGFVSDADYSRCLGGGYNPQGCFDVVESNADNQITVYGWAFDRDSLGSDIVIHVYVGGPACTVPGYAITANTSRPDVNNAYPGVGNNHGFASSINIDRNGQQTVYVYAINVGEGTNVLLGTKTVNVKGGASGSDCNLDAKVGRTITDLNSYYYKNGNISYKAGYIGQCTWFAFGRFYECTGIALKTAPNAKYWLSYNKSDSRVSVLYGAGNIRSNSIAVRTSGTYGHVMYVEAVTYSNGNPQYVYFTECNNDGNGVYDAGRDCILKKLSYSDFVSQKNPAGYIVAR